MAIENEFHGNHGMTTSCMDFGNGWSVHKMAYEVLELVEFAVSALEYKFLMEIKVIWY